MYQYQRQRPELTDAIELTWHRRFELRNELYELEMGPSDILEIMETIISPGYYLSNHLQAFHYLIHDILGN
eukprot:scaffold27987_cov66-Cyclotella_meneghiniana.AAC.1